MTYIIIMSVILFIWVMSIIHYSTPYYSQEDVIKAERDGRVGWTSTFLESRIIADSKEELTETIKKKSRQETNLIMAAIIFGLSVFGLIYWSTKWEETDRTLFAMAFFSFFIIYWVERMLTELKLQLLINWQNERKDK